MLHWATTYLRQGHRVVLSKEQSFGDEQASEQILMGLKQQLYSAMYAQLSVFAP